MLQAGRAPGFTSDGCLVSGHLHSEAATRVAGSTAPLAAGDGFPCTLAGVPAAQDPAQRGVRSPGWSLLAGTEVTGKGGSALGSWPRQNPLPFCFSLLLSLVDDSHS